MKKAIRLYGQLLMPWLVVIVYLWLLQLMAVFGTHDPEPLFDQAADWSAILWTLLLWTGLAVLIVCALAVASRLTIAQNINDGLVKAALILVTAFYFIRWLFTWASLLEESKNIGVVLFVVSLVLGFWAWRRRADGRRTETRDFLILQEAYFFVFCVLAVTALIIVFKVGANEAQLWANRMVVQRKTAVNGSLGNSPDRRPNVILVVADALRAQNMSLFGYQRDTTPFLKRFAESSSVFTQMYANSTSTKVSLTTILSGKHPFSHGRLTRLLPAYEGAENLVALLRNEGYTTAAVTSNLEASFGALGLTKYLVYGQYANFSRLTLSWLRDHGVYPTLGGNRMYEELSNILPFLGFPDNTLRYGPAEDTLAQASHLLLDLPEPYFLFIHVYEPHSPYITPAPFRGRYTNIGYGEAERMIPSSKAARYPPGLQPFVDIHRDHYDEAIAYLDFELNKFFQSLGDKTHLRNSLVILTSDHGESFERGFFIHGEDLYESSVHVPLIIKYPNQDHGTKSRIPVQSIDIAPTILSAIGIPVPRWMDGETVTADRSPEVPDMLITNYKEPDERRIYEQPTELAIKQGHYKLLVSCETGRAELYDLSADPGERVDLSRSEFKLVARMWRRLQRVLVEKSSTARMVCPFTPGA